MVPQALELYRRSVKINSTPKVLHANLAKSLHGIAAIYLETGRLSDARELAIKVLEAAEQSGLPFEYARALYLQSEIDGFAMPDEGEQAAFEKLSSSRMRQTHGGRYYASLADAYRYWNKNEPVRALTIMKAAQVSGIFVRAHWLSSAISIGTGMAIATGNHDLARNFVAEMETHHNFFRETIYQGTPEFYKAALAHVYGSRAEAWNTLRAIRHVGPGPVQTQVCLAIAWLACEDRNLADAAAWLTKVDYLVQENPTAIMVLARYQYETGNWRAAVGLQEKLLQGNCNVRTKAFDDYLHSAYLQALTSGEAIAIRRLPHLVSLLPFGL
ncbi:hypothetical protein VARIO8X_120116 [Burkholderiales bacterium 8X]|nr:hypothetical protein VARIO8X_120116 [Burkholderiales bacterium 8X]